MTRAVLFGTAGVVVVGTAGFLAGRLSVTDLRVVPMVKPEYRVKVAELEEWSAGPRPALSKAEWRQRYGDDIALAARRVMEGLAATSYPDIEAIYNAHQFARNLSVEQIQEALAEIAGASRPEAATTMEAALLNQWAAIDGEGALKHALAAKNYRRNALVLASMTGWVKHDAEAAAEWYREHADDPEMVTVPYALLDRIVFGGLARTDMSGALRGIEELEWPRRDQVVSAIAGQIYHDSGMRAEYLRRLGEFEDEGLLRSAQGEVLASWAEHDPEAAARFFTGLGLSDQARDDLEARLMGPWMANDAQAALEWKLAGASSESERQAALETHFGTWLVREEAAASDWLAGQPEELQSDRVFEAAARALTVERPERALTWAAQIIDEGTRRELLAGIYADWSANSPATAGLWLDAQDEDMKNLVAGGGEAPPRGGAANAIVEAVEEELRALEDATGLSPAEMAVKRQQLQALLDSFSGAGDVPVNNEGE